MNHNRSIIVPPNNNNQQVLNEFNGVFMNFSTYALGFVIRNQLNPADTNIYIVFPAHTYPLGLNKTEVEFYLENIRSKKTGKLVNSNVFFKIIGIDNLNDFIVAVLDTQNSKNNLYTYETLSYGLILSDFNFTQYSKNYVFTCYQEVTEKYNKVSNFSTVLDFNYNGPPDMNIYYYPKSILLNDFVFPGASGSPILDNDFNILGMVSKRVSDSEDPRIPISSRMIATHCSMLYNGIFNIIIPQYLIQVQYAIDNPTLPNILNNVDYLANFISNNMRRNYLGLYGTYMSREILNKYPIINDLENVDGFIITSFITIYIISSNTFDITKITKNNDPDKIRVYNIFAPQNKNVSRLYNRFYTSKYPIIVLDTLTYNLGSNNEHTLELGNISYLRKDTLADFIVNADPNLPIRVHYYYYENEAWQEDAEILIAEDTEYLVNGQIIKQKNTAFPQFITGFEPIASLWNKNIYNGQYYRIPYCSDQPTTIRRISNIPAFRESNIISSSLSNSSINLTSSSGLI